MKKNKIIYLVLILGICGIIFFFSHQPSEESSATSGRIADFLVNIISKVKEMPIEEEILVREIINSVIRKIAHLSIYMLLGISLILWRNTYQESNTQKIGISLAIGTFYAATDEIHQLFVLGRSGEIKDVFLDSIGVSLRNFIGVFSDKNVPKKEENSKT